MNILLIHHVADLYGSSRSLLRLTTALVRDGHSAQVILQEKGPLQEALQLAGAVVHVMPRLPVLHRNKLKSPGGIMRLVKDIRATRSAMLALMRTSKPDIVHTNSATALPVAGACARRLGIPHVLHIREFFLEFGVLWRVYRSVLMRYADLILCVSQSVAEQFPVTPRVAVLHNGFPASEFPPLTDSERQVFRTKHAPGLDPLAGVIGRIKLKRKGQETLVAAAARLHDEFPGAGFLLVGAPFRGNESHEDEIKGLIHKAGLEKVVKLTGEVSNPRAAFAALDIVVMSSGTPEPFGGVVIEAMAYGLPVVGTAIGGTTEQIADGETGLLIPPNDPAAMAEALASLLRDPARREAMGRKARERFLDRFEFKPFYEKLITHYRVLTSRT